jgi:hypothetical protein
MSYERALTTPMVVVVVNAASRRFGTVPCGQTRMGIVGVLRGFAETPDIPGVG